MPSCPYLVSLLLLWGLPAFADDLPRPDSPVPSDPIFQVLKTDGRRIAGRIRQMGPKEAVTLSGSQAQEIVPFDHLVKLERENRREAPLSPPEGSMVLFPEGDRLRAGIESSSDSDLKVRPPALGDAVIAIPLDGMSAIILSTPVDSEAAEQLIEKVRTEPRKSDILWLANGDRLAGDLLALGPDKVRFQGEGAVEPREIERSIVVAIGFDPARIRYPKPVGSYLELTFVDGSRLGVSNVRVESGAVAATTRIGAKIKLPLSELSRVHARGNRIAYLSEREPAGAQYAAYVGPTRPYRRDASVEGRTLRLEGVPYDRGLGMQGRTYVAYRLDDTERRFQARIGLDDRAGPLGSVVFRVLVDRKVQRYASPPMSSRDEPIEVDIDISGSQLLILEADFGERGDVRDFADWVEARVIR
jgi:hypothetical protein